MLMLRRTQCGPGIVRFLEVARMLIPTQHIINLFEAFLLPTILYGCPVAKGSRNRRETEHPSPTVINITTTRSLSHSATFSKLASKATAKTILGEKADPSGKGKTKSSKEGHTAVGAEAYVASQQTPLQRTHAYWMGNLGTVETAQATRTKRQSKRQGEKPRPTSWWKAQHAFLRCWLVLLWCQQWQGSTFQGVFAYHTPGDCGDQPVGASRAAEGHDAGRPSIYSPERPADYQQQKEVGRKTRKVTPCTVQEIGAVGDLQGRDEDSLQLRVQQISEGIAGNQGGHRGDTTLVGQAHEGCGTRRNSQREQRGHRVRPMGQGPDQPQESDYTYYGDRPQDDGDGQCFEADAGEPAEDVSTANARYAGPNVLYGSSSQATHDRTRDTNTEATSQSTGCGRHTGIRQRTATQECIGSILENKPIWTIREGTRAPRGTGHQPRGYGWCYSLTFEENMGKQCPRSLGETLGYMHMLSPMRLFGYYDVFMRFYTIKDAEYGNYPQSTELLDDVAKTLQFDELQNEVNVCTPVSQGSQSHRDIDGQEMDYTHQFHQGGILLLFFRRRDVLLLAPLFGTLMPTGMTQSLDEEVLADMQARNAMAEQDAIDRAREQAWQILQQQTGFPRPEDEPRVKLYRGGHGHRTALTSMTIHQHPMAHPDDIVRRIASQWTDLDAPFGQPCTWEVFLAHPSIAGSHKIDLSFAHYVLLSADDILQEPDGHTVLFEIHNNYVDRDDAEVYAFRFSEPITRASIITEAGYLAVCSQTLRCRTWHNDSPLDGQGTHTQTADYVLLSTATMRVAPPGLSTAPRLSMAQDITNAHPTPSSAPQHATVHAPQVHDEVEDFDEQLCVIFRPDFGQGRPIAARTSGILTEDKITGATLHTWPELRAGHLSMMEVHRSYKDDFNFDPPTVYAMAVWDQDFGIMQNLRAILVHLRIDTTRDLRGVPLAHQTSGYGLATWARISHRCYRARSYICSIWHNGHQVHGANRVTLDHGDYIRIEAYPVGNDPMAFTMVHVFDGQTPGVPNMDRLWPPPPTLRAGTIVTSTQTIAVPRPSRSRSRNTLHEAFWIYNALLCFVGVFTILYSLPNDKIPTRRKPRSRPRVIKPIRTSFFVGLILLQHCMPYVHALQTHHANTALSSDIPQGDPTPGWKRYLDCTESDHLTPTSRETTLSPCRGLPPPGNPEDHWNTMLTRTRTGEDLQNYIVNYLKYKDCSLRI